MGSGSREGLTVLEDDDKQHSKQKDIVFKFHLTSRFPGRETGYIQAIQLFIVCWR